MKTTWPYFGLTYLITLEFSAFKFRNLMKELIGERVPDIRITP